MFSEIIANLGQMTRSVSLDFSSKAGQFFEEIRLSFHPLMVVDIIIVATLIYWFYDLIRETRAVRVLYGFLILAFLATLAYFLKLTLLSFLMKYLALALLVMIPVVFQPELRRGLERLGRGKIIGDFSLFSRHKAEGIIADIAEVCGLLARHHVGGLLIISRKQKLYNYLLGGTKLGASFSRELLLSLLVPKSPLHQGAVLIEGDQISGADYQLPITRVSSSTSLGNRHRAGLEISHRTDAIAIIVSSETGQIALAESGTLREKVSRRKLSKLLLRFLRRE